MRRRLPSLVQLLMRLGAAKAEAGRAFQFVQMQIPEEGQPVTRETFQFRVDKQKLQEAEWRDGHYLLRSNLTSRRSQRAMDPLRAVDPDRIGIPIAEE